MGIHSMIQSTVRVAAFIAVSALLLQVSCMPDLPAIPVQNATQSDPGCLESAPPTPNAPDSSHICCSGDHSPDALLSATFAPVPLISEAGASHLTSPLPSLALVSTDFPASFSPPHGFLTLRI
jgi:hypothetical protein